MDTPSNQHGTEDRAVLELFPNHRNGLVSPAPLKATPTEGTNLITKTPEQGL